jgi:hypothetical protein
MSTHAMRLVVWAGCLTMAAAGCGGTGSGDPLVGNIAGQFRNQPFSVAYGFAAPGADMAGTPTSGMNVWFSSGPSGCGSDPLQRSVGGDYRVLMRVDGRTAGQYTGQTVTVFTIAGSFSSTSGSGGAITLTEVGASSVSGTVAFTTTGGSETTAVTGSFTVARCF